MAVFQIRGKNALMTYKKSGALHMEDAWCLVMFSCVGGKVMCCNWCIISVIFIVHASTVCVHHWLG